VSEVRLAREGDVAALLAIEESGFDPPWTAVDLQAELAREETRSWVAVRDGAVAGFLLAWLVAGELQVHKVAVAPPERGKGLGRALVQRALDAARAEGAEAATLEVRAGNAPAIAVYLRCGFEEVGRRPGYYTDGEEAVLMTASLGPAEEAP
jgi:ribosomal-protein-alanine N-acetyltransferase